MFDFIKKITDNFKSADMSISGNMKITTLQQSFKENFGLYLRVYKGTRFANPDITIAKLNKTSSSSIDTTADSFIIKASMKTVDVEALFMSNFGLKVQVADLYNRHLVSDKFTLGENSRRKGEDLWCKEKHGKSELEHIQSEGFEDLESYNKHVHAKSKLGDNDFTGKMRGVFSLNFPHLFIRFDDNKIDEDICLKELNKLTEEIDITREIIGSKKVKDFEKDLKSLLNCNVEIFHQIKAKAHYKKVMEINKNITLDEAENQGSKENWAEWTEWAIEKVIRYN